jgi:hypothetical protein
MKAMELNQRPHLGRDGTYNSGNQKLLAVKGSKSSLCYSWSKRGNRDNSGLHECKWKQLDSTSGSV